MELRIPHMLHLFNVFRKNDGKENCAQVLEEELHRMLGIKYVNGSVLRCCSYLNKPPTYD